MTDPWELIQSRQYEAAVEEYSRLYDEKGDRFNQLEWEYHLARWEVERGFPQPAFETA
jgi:hypothetical protein